MSGAYAVLGLLPSAHDDEIRASFRRLAKRCHPDMPGGSPRSFARVQQAYAALSTPERRRAYDVLARRNAPAPRPAAEGGRAPDRRAPVPVLTRIMSLAVPRDGRFQLQGLIGDIQIAVTTPHTLWETTLRKFGATDRERLARHAIQIKLSGERDRVRSLMPRPTDFGVEFQRLSAPEKRRRLRAFLERVLGGPSIEGFFFGAGRPGTGLPLSLHVTVPRGTALHLRDVTGTISVGHLEGELVASLGGGMLRAGRLTRAHVTLRGGSRALLSEVLGPVDLIGSGTSHAQLGGRMTQSRTVLGGRAQLEVTGSVGRLRAEVNGRGRLDVREAVDEAHCDVGRNGTVRLARVRQLTGARAPGATLEAWCDGDAATRAG